MWDETWRVYFQRRNNGKITYGNVNKLQSGICVRNIKVYDTFKSINLNVITAILLVNNCVICIKIDVR